MCGDLTGLKYRKGFMEKMYSLSDQDDPQDPSLLAFQVHPVEEISQFYVSTESLTMSVRR